MKRKRSLELKKINPALEQFPHGYAATLIAGNEYDLDDSEHLSSRFVLAPVVIRMKKVKVTFASMITVAFS